MNKIMLILCCLLTFFAGAQSEKNNWYFGDRAAISFETGSPVVKYDNPQDIYGPSASISDPVTGKLLFYTNGKNIWNNQHQVMVKGGDISTGYIGDVLIVPDPVNTLLYYVFYSESQTIRYVKVDMNQKGGVVVTLAPVSVLPDQLAQFTVFYHPYRKAFWLISHTLQSTVINASLFNEQGIMAFTSFRSIGREAQQYGDMVINHKGSKIAVTHYRGIDELAETFDFDPVCGTFSNARDLDKLPNWDWTYGAAFSPDDSKLYITYSGPQSQLVQYYGANFENSYFIADAPDNFNILRLANDGKIYISTHDGGVPGPRIDAILKPNVLATSCEYRKTYLNIDNGTQRNVNFTLPDFASGKPLNETDDIFEVKQSCLGQPTEFKFKENYTIDSLRWDFGNGGATSTDKNTKHTYLSGGKFVVTLTVFKCGNSYEITDTISIDSPPEALFPSDTVVCFGFSVTLTGPNADYYLWSNGQTSASILVKKPGLVWLRSTVGNCSGYDSVEVSYYPGIFTALGDEYFICDDDKELVKLDAGGEFDQYKWTPTGDTSQWILVGDVGKYFVVVKDFRGCDGKDGTKVERRCPVSVYYPNAFTPNNDGLNDVFLPVGSDVVSFDIQVYNAWGQQIFESQQLDTGWDGKLNGIPAPVGTYFYRSTYSGYRNKKLMRFETQGNMTMLR